MGTYTWTTWCTSTSATVTCGDTWGNWTTSGTSTTVTSNVWYMWVTAGTTSGTLTVSNSGYVDERTAEQKAADEARWARERAEVQARAAVAEAARQEAVGKARRLLLSMLEHQQREQLEKEHFFEVIAKHSKRRYRIRQGSHGNVRLLDDKGREVTSYCAQPNGVPTEDSMLAQKLQIEHDEAAFLKVANATQLRVA